MSLYLLDTNIVTSYGQGIEPVMGRVDACPIGDQAISVLTVEEQLSGWYTALRKARRPDALAHAYGRLAQVVPFLARWSILPYTEAAMRRVEAWQKLRLGVEKMDLRIAAVALENDAVVVTRNLRDFNRIPGVVSEDWGA